MRKFNTIKVLIGALLSAGFVFGQPVMAEMDDNPQLTIFACQGEQTHELVLQALEEVPSLTYFADGQAVGTVLATDSFVDELSGALYIPLAGTWYAFNDTAGHVWANGNVDSCSVLVRPMDVIDAQAAGLQPVMGILANTLGYEVGQ